MYRALINNMKNLNQRTRFRFVFWVKNIKKSIANKENIRYNLKEKV